MSENQNQNQQNQEQQEKEVVEVVLKTPAYPMRFKAYHTGKLNTRTDVHDYCDLFEVNAHRVTLYSTAAKKWCHMHPRIAPKLTYGENQIVMKPFEPRYYNDYPDPAGGIIGGVAGGAVPGASYVFLVDKLVKRRHYNMPKIELDMWLSEAEQEHDVKLVPEPLPGIAIVREIFIASNLENLLHPITELEEQAVASPFERDSYSVEFKPVRWCSFLDCPVCYSEPQLLEQPEIVILGKSRFDSEAIQATQKYRENPELFERPRKLHLMKLGMQMIAIMNATADVFDKLDESDESDEEEFTLPK